MRQFKRSWGDWLFDSGNMIVLGALAFVTIYPFLYTLVLSLSSASAALEPGFRFWPSEVNLSAYKAVFSNRELMVGFRNSLFRTVAGTFGVLLICSMLAYPLSRPELVHRKGWTIFILITMVFQGGLIPTYLLIRNLGLIDNLLVYILPGLVTGFNVLIMKNFFQGVPSSIAESARIDGASEWRILFTIYLPLSKPVLATVGLWTAVAQWNAWIDALLYINSDSKQVLQMFLQRIVIGNNTEMIERNMLSSAVQDFTPETIKAATVIVTVLPIICLYPFLQKYFLKGAFLGSVKE
jgi:putative aldouronate transport system permease protein